MSDVGLRTVIQQRYDARCLRDDRTIRGSQCVQKGGRGRARRRAFPRGHGAVDPPDTNPLGPLSEPGSTGGLVGATPFTRSAVHRYQDARFHTAGERGHEERIE